VSESTPGPERPEGAVEVRLRRAPRYGPFIATGVVVGVLLGVVVALVGGSARADGLSAGSLVRYFAAIFGLLGAVAGAAAALLVERRRR
jgi:hypothetical protein